MSAIITYPGWGPYKTYLPVSKYDLLLHALSSAGVNRVHLVKVNFDYNIVTVDLAAGSGMQTEKSVLGLIFSSLASVGLEKSVIVAIRDKACTPAVAYVGVNPATGKPEYLNGPPRLIDDASGRNPVEINHSAVDPNCRKGKGYKPHHAPGGISPRCTIKELNEEMN